MPGIAIKYWAFQQTGWGHVDETPPPAPEPEPEPEVQARSDYQDWKWIGVPGELLKSPKKLISHVEQRILTALHLYIYSTERYDLEVRTQENLPFISAAKNAIECQSFSILTARKPHDYLSVAVRAPNEKIENLLFNFDHAPIVRYDYREEIAFRLGKDGYDHQENIALRWLTREYHEVNVRPNFPLSLIVNLRERHDLKTRSVAPIPWHIRTPILEYVRWKKDLPNMVDDEVLMAALAQIIIDLEENE